MAESVIILLVVPVPTSLTLRGRSWAVGQLNRIRHYGSTVNPIPRLRHCCVLLSCCPEQGPDLHQPSASLRLGRLDRLCYSGCSCEILNQSSVYLSRRRKKLSSTGLRNPLPSMLVECVLEILQSSALSQVGQAHLLQGPGLGGFSNDRSVKCIHVTAAKLFPL